jgi:hypothetical protein
VEAAIALKVRDGWFFDLGGAETRASKPGAAKVAKEVITSEWLDDVGAGVLGVSVTRTGEFHSVMQEGGEQVEYSSELDESDRRFCGLDLHGAPSCTGEILERCYGGFSKPPSPNDYGAELEFESNSALLSVSAQGSAGPSCFFGIPLRDGRYEPPFMGILSAAERSAGVLQGPYASLESYCTAVRHGSKKKCVLGLGRWNRGVETTGADRDSPRVRLVRVKDDMAGAPVEYCRLGIEAHDGWYFTGDAEICQGGFGDMATVETKALSLAWVGAASDPAFVLTTRRSEERGEYREPVRGDHRKIGVSTEEIEYAEPCVVPKTGAPRCGPVYLVACSDAQETRREAHWSFDSGALKFPASMQVECRSGMTLGSVVGEPVE